MKTIAESKFREQFISLPENLDPEGTVITKRGKPVARLIPAGSCADLIGSMKGQIKIHGKIFFTGAKRRADV
ncbi:MAG TPA: hypothetical protein VI636_11280 [Candidatus Angelobacter sp.]